MNPAKVLKIAWKGLVSNKLRSLLTMLGVIIGVAAVIVMISISAGTEKAIEDQITGLGSNLIYIQSSFSRGGFGPGGGGMSGGLVFDDAAAIGEVNGVAGYVVEQQSSEQVKYGSTIVESVTILGTTADYPTVRDMTVASGRYVTQTDIDRDGPVAVLGSEIAKELFGDDSPLGETIIAGTVRLTVVGVLEEKAWSATPTSTRAFTFRFR